MQNEPESGDTCYALRLYHYDYYEWEDVHAVSFDKELLRAHYEGLKYLCWDVSLRGMVCRAYLYRDSPLVDELVHTALAQHETNHWTIEPINLLH